MADENGCKTDSFMPQAPATTAIKTMILADKAQISISNLLSTPLLLKYSLNPPPALPKRTS